MRTYINYSGLDSQFIDPLMKVLCPDESKTVTSRRYEQFITSFMIQSEQNGGDLESLEEPVVRLSR